MSGVDSPAARVYARALFEAAGDESPVVATELGQLVALRSDSPETWAALTAPQVTTEQRLATIEQMYANDNVLSRNFLKVLVQRGRLQDLPEIVAEFGRLVQEQQNQLDVHVTTAIDLPDDLRSKLEERLSSSTGKQVRLHATVDPDIIGGLVVQHGDTLVDTSLRGRLDSLKLSLQRGALRGTATTE